MERRGEHSQLGAVLSQLNEREARTVHILPRRWYAAIQVCRHIFRTKIQFCTLDLDLFLYSFGGADQVNITLQALHTLLHGGVEVVHCQGAVLVDGYFHCYFSFLD